MEEKIMTVLIIIAVAVISYLIGSVNFSILLSRIIEKKDIRESGSGNAGATNMLRTYGKKMGIITLLLDVLKGIVAILLAIFVVRLINVYRLDSFPTSLAQTAPLPAEINVAPIKYIAGVCAILGHNFPLYFGFKGGKGVATSLGVVLMLDWKVGLIVAAIAIAVMAITRYVSLGSIIGGALYIIIEVIDIFMVAVKPFLEFGTDAIKLIALPTWIKLVCVVIIGGLLIVRHHANIKRLLNGTENKLSFKKSE